MTAGTAMPPIAAAMGVTALRGLLSSPETISLLISTPTTKKKMAMRPSLIQSLSVWCSSKSPMWSEISRPHTASYDADHGEFAHSMAITAQRTRTTPAAGSILRNSAAGRPT